jgi:hypothetical protein
VDEIQGVMRKIKPPTFDGDHRKYEDAKSWLLGMRKYFPITQLFLTTKMQNCNLPAKGKNINVVGPACENKSH